jgi:hypothetical protein
MMPTPFVLNDAVVIKQKIKPTPVVLTNPLDTAITYPVIKDRLTVVRESSVVK